MNLLECLKKEYATFSEVENLEGLRGLLIDDGAMNAAPELLAINIYRFARKSNGTDFIFGKNARKVVIHQTINWPDLVLVGGGHPFMYKIRFVIVHEGNNLNSGHFRAYVRDFSSTSNNWFSVNDDKVMAVQIQPEEYVNTFSGATMVVYHKMSANGGYGRCKTEDCMLQSEFVYGIYFEIVMVPFLISLLSW